MKRTITFAVIAVLLAGLTACSPRPADPHPTAASPEVVNPTDAAPAPVALIPSFVVINAYSVSVGATTQEQIVDVPYSTVPETAVALLSDAMGAEPAVSTVDGTGCSLATTIWDWGGMRIAAPAPDGAGPGALFIARATAPETGNGLDIDLTYADTVGSSLADVIAHGPASYTVLSTDLGAGHTEAMLDGQDGDTWGVIMVVEGGIVDSFFAPGYYLYETGIC
jgi:hypothetical protein